jgi:hypothetical protein
MSVYHDSGESSPFPSPPLKTEPIDSLRTPAGSMLPKLAHIICPIFSAVVMRASKSCTRASAGCDGSLYRGTSPDEVVTASGEAARGADPQPINTTSAIEMTMSHLYFAVERPIDMRTPSST